MGRRDELIALYAGDLRTQCGIVPDMDLLTAITIGCGPAIYDAGAAVVAASDPAELAALKENFLVRKLDLMDGPDLMDAIDAALETYGRHHPRKYRAVIHYLLVLHFRKESRFG